MRKFYPIVTVMLFVWLCRVPGYLAADTEPRPLPQLEKEDGQGFSTADLQRMLLQLKSEREGLNTDWQSFLKRNTPESSSMEMDSKQLQAKLTLVLKRLQQAKAKKEQTVPPEHIPDKTKNETPAPAVKTDNHSASEPKTMPATDKAAGPVDALSQAHALFRTKQYDDALTSFRQVDLQGKKAIERAPVQYLMGICMLHLGKNDEAVSTFQDVTNSRGDPQVAAYAQRQLESYRWQTKVKDRLQEFRQRRKTLEKRS